MYIGIDATCWQNTRGYGRHARALIRSLLRCDQQNAYTLFVDSDKGLEDLPSHAIVRHIPSYAPTVHAASANGHRSLRDMWGMSRALSTHFEHVIFFPTIYSYVPLITRAKTIVMIHDVIPETFPQFTQPHLSARWLWKIKSWLGRFQADALVTVSEYSRQLLITHFELDPCRVFVVGEASDPVFRLLPDPQPTPRLRELGITTPSRCLIYVGGFGPHKNVSMLIRALAAIASNPGYDDVRLFLVGENARETYYSEFETLKRLVAELGMAERAIFTGYLDDQDLVTLLNQGTALILPSLMEGFGLPAIEAASCGCPVIATRASPLPQILGNGGLYIDPSRETELEAALRAVLDSPELRCRMRSAGIAAAQQLTWDYAAIQLHTLIHQVASL